MIRSSTLLKGLALVTALGAHSLAAVPFNDAPETLIESDAGGQSAALGNSFADMAAGTLAPKTPDTLQKPKPPEPNQPEQTVEKTLPEEARETAPLKTAALTPQPAQHRVKPLRANAPVQAQNRATTNTPNSTAITRSQRPKQRTQELEKRAALTKPQPLRKSKSGNAKRNAKAGAKSGTRTAKAKTQGIGNAAQKRSGNAAASNYPGRVMARISSVGRPRANARGTAVIRFTIGSNGGLSAAGVSQSSGSRRLDSAALNIIHRAAPFPKPPSGARRSYSINIAGR